MRFLNYGDALAALRSRYPDLAEAELRMWVDGRRGLWAWTERPRAFFSWSGTTDSNALMDCRFLAKQIFRFVPYRRYLTYGQLVARWQARVSGDIHRFIEERVAAFRTQKPGWGFLDFGAFDPLGRLDLPARDFLFAVDQVEEKEREWFAGVLPSEDNRRSPLVGLTTDYHRWKPLAEYPESRHHLDLMVKEGNLRVAVKVLPKRPDEWEAFLIPIPPDIVGDPVNATANYQARCFHEPHDPTSLPLLLRLEGFWYLDIEEAFTLFRDGEVLINYLFPPDPAALRQQWPNLFPSCDFFFALTRWNRVRVEDLYWRGDLQSSKAADKTPIHHKDSELGKKMRQARAEKNGETMIKAKAVKLAEAYRKKNRRSSKKAVANHVCDQIFDEARAAGVLFSRENAPDTIMRWLSKAQTTG